MTDELPIPNPLPDAWASWLERTQRLWQEFWVSEFAHFVVLQHPTSQLVLVEDLFGLYDRVYRGEERSYEVWRMIGWYEGKLGIGDDVRETLGLPAPPPDEPPDAG